MNNKTKSKYELVAPAGDFQTLVKAVNAGADAVYIGLQEFNMRDTAKNFKVSDLKKVKKTCKDKQVKVYLTLNTIIYDNEISNIKEILKKVKSYIDAVICWDLYVVNLCRNFKIPFHISTQASVSNVESAKFYKNLGAKRIVLARELNLSQIKKISKVIDVECFVHGAMCVAISGRCFTSQFLFNKSANRGKCLHPCRRAYSVIAKDKQEGYELEIINDKILSAKDLCALPFIEKLKKVGIKAFKIEGRNRDPRYVDTVVRVYRKALDKRLSKKEMQDSLSELEKIYNKGFSSGFYLKLPTSDDFSKVKHSASKEKKHFIGKVTKYFPNVGVSAIKLVSELKVGDDIVIVGKDTPLQSLKVERIEIYNKSIKIANKGDEVGIKTNPVKKNDEVYRIIKK